jgi:hypothetical protein
MLGPNALSWLLLHHNQSYRSTCRLQLEAAALIINAVHLFRWLGWCRMDCWQSPAQHVLKRIILKKQPIVVSSGVFVFVRSHTAHLAVARHGNEAGKVLHVQLAIAGPSDWHSMIVVTEFVFTLCFAMQMDAALFIPQ